MENNVTLKRIGLENQESLNQILKMINSDEELRNVFAGQTNTIKRIANACYTAFIEHEKDIVGFVMLVVNERTNTIEADVGVLKKYRKLGYGTEALGILKEIVIANNLTVEAQVQNTNTAAIKSVIRSGGELVRQDEEHSYYAFGPDESEKSK